MAELLSISQSDCNHAAALIERLTNENNQLKKQARLHKEPGNSIFNDGSKLVILVVHSGLEQVLPGTASYDKICRERDQLKETVKNFETELIQVRLEIYTSCTMYSYCLHTCNYMYM